MSTSKSRFEIGRAGLAAFGCGLAVAAAVLTCQLDAGPRLGAADGRGATATAPRVAVGSERVRAQGGAVVPVLAAEPPTSGPAAPARRAESSPRPAMAAADAGPAERLLRGVVIPRSTMTRLCALDGGRAVILATSKCDDAAQPPIRAVVQRDGSFVLRLDPDVTACGLCLAVDLPGAGPWLVDAGSRNVDAASIQIDASALSWRDVSGRVRRRGAGELANAARVVFRSMHAAAEPGAPRDVVVAVPSGRFAARLVAGRYAVAIDEGAGSVTWLPDLVDIDARSEELDLQVGVAGPGSIVVRDINGVPIAEQPVVLRPVGGNARSTVAEGRTDRDGRWQLAKVADGSYSVARLEWASPPRPGERLTASSPKARAVPLGTVFLAGGREAAVYGPTRWAR